MPFRPGADFVSPAESRAIPASADPARTPGEHPQRMAAPARGDDGNVGPLVRVVLSEGAARSESP